MATLGGKPSTKGNKRILLIIGVIIIVIIFIIGSILLIGAFYFLLYKPLKSTVTVSNVSKIDTTTTTTSTTTSTSPTTTTIIQTTTSTTSSTTTSSTTSTTSSTTIQSTTTLLPDMSRIAQCFNSNGVRLYVSDTCLEIGPCRSIKDAFGSAFNELNVINCDEDGTETECDTAREDRGGSLGFPLWYIEPSGEYYAPASISRIRSVTGCN